MDTATPEEITREEAVTIALSRPLTELEIAAIAHKLASTAADRGIVQAEFDSVKKTFKEKIDALTGEINGDLNKIFEGVEIEEVNCQRVFNYSDGTVTTTRLDTKEIIEERELTEEELQMYLDLQDQEAAPEEEPEQPEVEETPKGDPIGEVSGEKVYAHPEDQGEAQDPEADVLPFDDTEDRAGDQNG